MRLLILFMLAGLLHVSAASYSQTVTLHGENLSLTEVFRAVRQQTGYAVYGYSASMKDAKPVSIHAEAMPLVDFLTRVLRSQPIDFEVEDRTIVIKPHASSRTRLQHEGAEEEAAGTLILAYAEVRGRVVDSLGNPLAGASVRVLNAEGKRTTLQTKTDRNGFFTLPDVPENAQLEISFIGYVSQTVPANPELGVVVLHVQTSSLEEVEVVSTGYQQIPKERATGSFEFVDSALFNRKVSTDFVSRLEDVVPSIVANKSFASNRGKRININVRGVSTMSSERWPLVVVDGVPYMNNFDDLNGYFNNINPNDVENVTVLKDAAASSIWGAQSGNGVIIITTKKGKFNQPLQVSLNSNVSISAKPDLYYYPQMHTSDYLDLERHLFDEGYWSSRMNRYSTSLTPVIQLLKQHKQNEIGTADLETRLDMLRNIDVRDDYLKYYYRHATNQQYSLRISGGGEKLNSSFAVGYDDNLGNLVTSSYNRLTVRNNTQFMPLKNLTVTLGINYTESKRKESEEPVGYNTMGRNFPYMQFADGEGNPLIVDAIGYNPTFRDTVAGGRLLDWKFRPLEELYETHNISRIRETLMNISTKYSFWNGFDVNMLYAYQHASQPGEVWRGLGSVSQRQSINYRASWNNDEIFWNLPVGDYLNSVNQTNLTHQGRFTLGFDRHFADRHAVVLLAGAEIRQVKTDVLNSVYWGYNRETLSFTPVEFGKEIPALNGLAGTITLDDVSNMRSVTNRFVSYFANGSYIFDQKYTLSASIRKDASNLFGVRSNDRGQPFWSLGGAWLISKEGFMENADVQLLKVRATYGFNGNMNNSVAAYPIMNVQSAPHYITGERYANMQTPPNPSLRWERVGMLNVGLDWGVFGNRLSGAVEYYVKWPKDLIASTRVDPTTGFSTLSVNSANLLGRGVDISLHGKVLQSGLFNWNSHFVFAYNRTTVQKSYISNNSASNHVAGAFNTLHMTPIEGMDLYSLLTYRWAGLDPDTGMPRGYLNDEVSMDYSGIISSSKVDDLENHGALFPVYFGSFRNSFSFRNLELSFNISYQLGHKFLRESFSNRYFISSGRGHADYARRWQKSGDELLTNVPAFTYPNDLYGSELYAASSALVESAGQIKWRDLQISYNVPLSVRARTLNARVYGYVQNLGTIWRGNRERLDPEYGKSIPDPLMVSLGFQLNM